MSVSIVSVPDNAPFWDQQTTLDGATFLLCFRYNYREATYYLSIGLPDGTPIACGLALVGNTPLLQAVVSPKAPLGELLVQVSGSSTAPPALGDFLNGRATLYYFPQASMIFVGMDPNRNPNNQLVPLATSP